MIGSCFPLIGAIVSLLLVYTVALVFDLLGILAGSYDQIDATECATTIGRRLQLRLRTFVTTVAAFEWQSKQLRVLSGGVQRDPLFRALLAESDWRHKGADALCAQITRYVKSRTRCLAVGFQLHFRGGQSGAMLGVEGDRFARMLQRKLAFAQRGLLDNCENDSVLGFRRTLVRTCSNVSGIAGIIWLGYGESAVPTSFEERFADELADAISDEIRYAEGLAEVGAQHEVPSDKRSDELAQFSHDLRSPLNNIKAILALFKFEELRKESTELLEVALANCRGLEAIVDDVLDLARFRAGNLSPRIETVAMRPLLEEIVDSFRVAARMKGLDLVCNPDAWSGHVRGDRNQLRRTFTNLISNALKYTCFGKVMLACGEMRNEVSVSISDTGIGMDGDQLKRLFTPFTRFNTSDTDGIGLGLSIAKVLVDCNGGRIDVQSKPGEGSCFTVSFPAHRVAENTSEKISKSANGKRVLIVDDDADAVRTLARLAARDGFTPLQATTVHDALGIINFERPDIVITDAAMPGGGGRKILHFVNSAQPRVPVVVLSGDRSQEHELIALGAAAVIEKPCEYSHLRTILLDLFEPALAAATA